MLIVFSMSSWMTSGFPMPPELPFAPVMMSGGGLGGGKGGGLGGGGLGGGGFGGGEGGGDGVGGLGGGGLGDTARSVTWSCSTGVPPGPSSAQNE